MKFPNLIFIVLTIITIFSMLQLTGCFLIDEELNDAVDSGNPKNCKKLDESEKSGRIDSCLRQMGIKEKDPNICKEIDDTYDKDFCYSELAKDKTMSLNLCEEVSSAKKASCYIDMAQARGSSVGVSICRSLPDDISSSKDDCIVKVAATGNNFIDLCQDVENPNKRDLCVINLAVGNNDEGLCVQGSSNNNIEKCVISVAKSKSDEKVCDSLALNEPPISKDDCLAQMAPILEKATICNDIELEKTKDSCLYNVASKKNEWEVCERISQETEKDRCYDHIARKTRSLDICIKILDSEKREKCEIFNAVSTT